MTRIKILARKNLKMSPGKLAAQAVHAALGLPGVEPMMSVVVLMVSDAKFQEAKSGRSLVIVKDAGYTEVAAGTETCLAYYEEETLKQERSLPPAEEARTNEARAREAT